MALLFDARRQVLALKKDGAYLTQLVEIRRNIDSYRLSVACSTVAGKYRRDAPLQQMDEMSLSARACRRAEKRLAAENAAAAERHHVLLSRIDNVIRESLTIENSSGFISGLQQAKVRTPTIFLSQLQ
jgi:hypothetical protein